VSGLVALEIADPVSDTRRHRVTSRTDGHIAEAVSALWAAADPKACSHIFRKTLALFEVDTFACGEVNLLHLDRTVFYAIGWPDSWRQFYMGSGLVRRDPLLDALKRHRAPFTWSDLRRDRKLSAVGSEALQLCHDHGWTEGLAVPIPRGDQRFGLVSLACRRRDFAAEEKSLLAMLSFCFHERLRNLAPKHGFALPQSG
jgi:LuxR family quorum sensing-dependent transcriptional regulator